MKKFIACLLVLLVCFGIAGCSAPVAETSSIAEVSTVAQSEFDNLKANYTKLQEEYNTLKTDYDKLKLEASSEASQAEIQEELRSPEQAIAIQDDEYVTISFLGCEKDDYDMESLVFHVINKTDVELTFQADAMALNGESLGYSSGSDSIAAQSKGKIRFSTKEKFPSLTPDTLSGTIKVIDFSDKVFSGSNEVTFTNLNVGTGTKTESSSSPVSNTAVSNTADSTPTQEETSLIKNNLEKFCMTDDITSLSGYSCEVYITEDKQGYAAKLSIPVNNSNESKLNIAMDSLEEVLTIWQKTPILGAPLLKIADVSFLDGGAKVKEKTITFE